MVSSLVVVGAQWGDEGKGKITDFLAQWADMVVRYQGGSNAGHTVVVGDVELRLHLIPSGIMYPEKTMVIGNGVVVDLRVLCRELDYLESLGIDAANLRIDLRAHLVFPYHAVLDMLEESKRGHRRIGTTGKGVGPAYTDKTARTGLRVADLLDENGFVSSLKFILEEKNRVFRLVYGASPLDADELLTEFLGHARRIGPYVTDTSRLINQALDSGKNVLFEGAQGTLLDLDFGTYPYVTSSHAVAGGACIGAGVGPTRIDAVIGVVKAYSSRVGDGPFPTELLDETGSFIREKGNEYGTTTGRPRRCGWLDIVAVRHAAMVNALDCIAVTRLDVLSGLPTLKICSGYRSGSVEIRDFPANPKVLAECEPVYEELPGWMSDLSAVRCYDALPTEAKHYLRRIEELSGLPVAVLSIGRERSQTIRLRESFGRKALSSSWAT